MSESKAKGFKPKRTLYKLDFSGTDLDGLEVTARGTSVGGLLELADVGSRLEELKGLDERAEGAQVREALRELFAPFAKVVVAWNVVDDDDEPVPASVDGFMSQEFDFITSIITSYVQAMTQAPPPLPGNSGSGTTSGEERAAMAALSSALPSSSPQRLLSGSVTGGTACRRRCSPSPPGCCGCSTSTGSATATRTRRGVSSHSRQLCIDKHKSD